MSEKKIKLNKKITAIGKFVAWMDGIDVAISRRIALLAVLIFAAGTVVLQQDSGWSLFWGKRVAALENSQLPAFSPGKEILSDSAIRCNNSKINPGEKAVGRYSLEQFAFKKNAEQIVQDKPMKEMLDAVAGRDNETASYLVAIAKKESNLGKFSPKKDGKDCYNYWGFRGTYNQTQSGYSCFDSPEQAVKVVGDRIQVLSQIGKRDTPQKMVIWKCGANCAATGGHAAAKKWIADVAMYYEKLNL